MWGGVDVLDEGTKPAPPRRPCAEAFLTTTAVVSCVSKGF